VSRGDLGGTVVGPVVDDDDLLGGTLLGGERAQQRRKIVCLVAGRDDHGNTIRAGSFAAVAAAGDPPEQEEPEEPEDGLLKRQQNPERDGEHGGYRVRSRDARGWPGGRRNPSTFSSINIWSIAAGYSVSRGQVNEAMTAPLPLRGAVRKTRPTLPISPTGSRAAGSAHRRVRGRGMLAIANHYFFGTSYQSRNPRATWAWNWEGSNAPP
jgi:hypothetical protein